eukprot:jgi/Bigna1/86708/estExt_fgenesh1_pg.C_130022
MDMNDNIDPPPICVRRLSSERRKRARFLRQRWIVLALICVIPLGSHFVRKELGPLKTAMLADSRLGLDNTRFAMLLSATALPNLLVPVFGGALLDIRGSRWGTMLFVVVTLLGQIAFASSVHLQWFLGAVLSQILVGVGAGSTVVSQAAISSEYFQATEMGLAVGIMESVHNLSNWMGQAMPAEIMQFFGGNYVSSLWFGALACAVSLIAGILYVKTDINAEEETDRIRPMEDCTKKDRHVVLWKNVTNITKLPKMFFGLTFLHMLLSTAHESFDNISANLITVRYGASAVDAGLLASIDNVFGLLLAPFVGILLDRLGYRLYFLSAMALLLACAQALLAFGWHQLQGPLLPLIILGFVNSSVILGWDRGVRDDACKGYDTSFIEWGIAFGVFEASEAMGSTVGNLLAGVLRDWTATYALVNVGFMCFGIVCFAVSLAMAMSRSEEAQRLLKPLASEGYCNSSPESESPGGRTSAKNTNYGSFGEGKS